MPKLLLSIILGGLLISSCVSSKKFSDLEVLKEYYKYKNDTLVMVQKENRGLQSELRSVKAQLGRMTEQYNTTKASLENLQVRYDDLNAQYDQLSANNQKLASSSQAENESLKAELATANKDNSVMRGILTNLDKAYQMSLNGAVLSNDTWDNKLTRMQEISETIDAERSQLSNLFGLMLETPIFTEEGFEVLNARQGLMLRLPSDQIFRKGASQLNTKGRTVIKELTGIILRNSNLNVQVIGHTDTNGKDSANWTLSSSRATAVAKYMIDEEFMPTRLSAIGRSSHDPINYEETTEAKKMNRRVEIIIRPRTTR